MREPGVALLSDVVARITEHPVQYWSELTMSPADREVSIW